MKKKIFKPYTIKKINGKKIGFIGLNVNPQGLISEQNIEGVVWQDIISSANDVASILKNKKKCDLVVAITHIGYENRDMQNEDFEDDTKDGGEVGYGHEVTVIYEIVPVDSKLKIFETDLKYQENVVSNSEIKDWLTVSIRHKPHGEKESILNEYVVDETSEVSEPSEDFKFISNAVAFGLIVNESDYIEGWTVDTVIENLSHLNLTDEDKKDFSKLVEEFKLYSSTDRGSELRQSKESDVILP